MDGLIDIAEEGQQYTWCIEGAIKDAEDAGMEVVRSTETTLLLDLDDGAAQDRYRRILRSLQGAHNLKEIARWTSQSGVGIHVVVSCKPMPFLDRIALQACLGSDPVREGLAVAMAHDGLAEPSVLFKPKSEVK